MCPSDTGQWLLSYRLLDYHRSQLILLKFLSEQSIFLSLWAMMFVPWHSWYLQCISISVKKKTSRSTCQIINKSIPVPTNYYYQLLAKCLQLIATHSNRIISSHFNVSQPCTNSYNYGLILDIMYYYLHVIITVCSLFEIAGKSAGVGLTLGK